MSELPWYMTEPWPPRPKVRPWRKGDPTSCRYVNKSRVLAPECGPPVAVVTKPYSTVTHPQKMYRTYAVCEHHRQALYDGRREAKERQRQVYQLGKQALLDRERPDE